MLSLRIYHARLGGCLGRWQTIIGHSLPGKVKIFPGDIMISLNSLERRVSILERPQNMGGIDPLVFAMEKLNDNELGLIDEYMSLLQSGFSPDEIEAMMEHDSYQAALDVIEKVDAEYRRLTEPVRPKRRGKALKMPREHRYDESGFGVREDAEA